MKKYLIHFSIWAAFCLPVLSWAQESSLSSSVRIPGAVIELNPDYLVYPEEPSPRRVYPSVEILSDLMGNSVDRKSFGDQGSFPFCSFVLTQIFPMRRGYSTPTTRFERRLSNLAIVRGSVEVNLVGSRGIYSEHCLTFEGGLANECAMTSYEANQVNEKQSENEIIVCQIGNDDGQKECDAEFNYNENIFVSHQFCEVAFTERPEFLRDLNLKIMDFVHPSE